ncbi:Nn.00g014990.m01.CDS01 [Neocucurbitaria sp. VM-36]
MSTHIPSPHRFLAPYPPSTQNCKQKPPSSLRNALAGQTPKPAVTTRQVTELQLKKLTPAKRFVIAPTRPETSTEGHTKGKERSNETCTDTRAEVTPRSKPRRKLERVESIEEASQSSITAGQDGDEEVRLVQSIERNSIIISDEAREEENQEEEMLFETVRPTKRRRTSPLSSPSRQREIEPRTPVPAHNAATTHRFKVAAPRTPAPFGVSLTTTLISTTPGPSTTAAPHRPHFLLPALPTSPPKPSKPLPEIFSPSRKNGKYISDGLASTVTGWIIETANSSFVAQDRSSGINWGRDREEGVRMKVRMEVISTGAVETSQQSEVECYAGSVIFVRGATEPGLYNASRSPSDFGEEGESRVLLAGQGGTRGSGGVKIKVGGIVGVRAPMWDVDVSGEKWVVGVDWVVL